MQRLFSGLTIGLCACLTGNALANAVVDFESITPGTQFGAAFGTTAGDSIFTENGVNVLAGNFSGSFSTATVGGFTDSLFPTTPMTLSNITLAFDPPQINGSAPTGVSFEYTDLGGTIGLGFNGIWIPRDDFSELNPSLHGVDIVVTESAITGGVAGTVTLIGPINQLVIGGQELGIDNITFVPEPTSLAMLAIGGLALFRRRRTQ